MKYDFLPLPAGFKMSLKRKRLADFDAQLRTFKEWSDDGYKILKGSKAVGRNNEGVCVFSGAQVIKYEPPILEEGDYYDEEEYDQDLPGNPADYGHSD